MSKIKAKYFDYVTLKMCSLKTLGTRNTRPSRLILAAWDECTAPRSESEKVKSSRIDFSGDCALAVCSS